MTIAAVYGCSTLDQDLPSGRILAPEKSLVGASFGLIYEREASERKSPSTKRSFDIFEAAHTLQFSYQRGLLPAIDAGISASAGELSFGARYGLFSGRQFASALGAKLIADARRVGTIGTYRFKLHWTSSFEFTRKVSSYVTPYFIDTGRDHNERWLGGSFGLLYGSAIGFFCELDYAVDTASVERDTIEQLQIGILVGLDSFTQRCCRNDPSSAL